jgi:hypothetical protein
MTAPAAPSTFLELVKRTYRECNLVNSPPSTCQSQVNLAGSVVNWVLAAAAEIEDDRDWRFKWATVSKVLQAGVDTYDPVADWAIQVKEWVTRPLASYMYLTSVGVSSRQWLTFMHWEIFRGLNVPTISSAVTTPIYWTINPLGRVVYFPTPGTALWTVVHEYGTDSTPMAADDDTPAVPAKYRMAIVWRAVMFYAGGKTHGPLYQHAQNELSKIMNRMEFQELPKMLSPGSLA